MTINCVEVYEYALTYVHGEYVMSGGRVIDRLSSHVVRVVTDVGVTGFGEVCPLGPAYLPAHARGARAALEELVPSVIGLDVGRHAGRRRAMSGALMGHAYAKSAVDVACWDAFGKTVGLPVCALLGGRNTRAVEHVGDRVHVAEQHVGAAQQREALVDVAGGDERVPRPLRRGAGDQQAVLHRHALVQPGADRAFE